MWQGRNRDGNWDRKERTQEDNSVRLASAPTPTQERERLIYNTHVILEYVTRKASSRLREEVLPVWYVN